MLTGQIHITIVHCRGDRGQLKQFGIFRSASHGFKVRIRKRSPIKVHLRPCYESIMSMVLIIPLAQDIYGEKIVCSYYHKRMAGSNIERPMPHFE